MKKIIAIFLVAGSSFLLANSSGDKIMEKFKWREDGKSRASEINLKIKDSSGGTRERKVLYIESDENKLRSTLLYVESPRDVRKTTILIQNDSSKKNITRSDIWLYIPVLGKSKKLSSQNKSGSFVGSNFQYADLEWIILEDFSYKLLGLEKVNGRMFYKIEAIAKNNSVIQKTGYTKKIIWLDKEYKLIVKADFFNRQGFNFKQLRVNNVQKIDGFWTIMKQTINDLVDNQQTIMTLKNVRYNVNPNPSIFNKQNLGEKPAW